MKIEIGFEERQELGLQLLDELDRVCNELHCRYYLAFGSLLGAVRHNGFIPWDDDIDVWMFREDYEKLCREFNSHCNSQYKLLSYHQDETYPFLPPKIVSLETDVVEKWMLPVKDLGIWIDIFPLDYVDENMDLNERKIIQLEHRRWMALYSKSTVGSKIKLFFYNLIQRDTKWKDRKEKPGYFSKQINSISHNTRYSELLVCSSSDFDVKKRLKTEDFATAVSHRFEDRQYPIPNGYDDILTTLYGNYMTPPPVRAQKRAKHLKSAKWKTCTTQK